jgi:hypothetical protein
MSSYSLINNQPEYIEKAVVPLGTGIAANSSPSISAVIPNQLAADVQLPGSLFVSDGALWNPSSFSGGFMFANSASQTSVTLALAGQPNITGGLMYEQGQTYGTNASNVGLILWAFTDGTAVSVTAAGEYISTTAVVPALYRPVLTKYFPCIVTCSASSPIFQNSYCLIDGSGFLHVYNPATSGTFNIVSLGGIYHL